MARIVFLMIICLAPVLCQERWIHNCLSEGRTVVCENGAIFELTGIYSAYRELGCPSDSTDPVSVIANCSQKYRYESIFKNTIVMACNQTSVCNITAVSGIEAIDSCTGPTDVISNFISYSYICKPGPSTAAPSITTTSKSEETRPSTQSTPQTTQPTAGPHGQSSTEKPFPYTIPLAAGAGAAVLIVLILFLVIFCYWRGRGDQSIEKAQPRKESVSYVNMSKVEENRKSAPRIKEENPNRPDITATTFHVDQSESPCYNSDPRGLYALPDKSASRDIKLEAGVDRSDTESNQAETSFNVENHQNNVEESQTPAKPSPKQHDTGADTGHTNIGYESDMFQYAEIPLHDNPAPQAATERHVKFEGDDNVEHEDRVIPDDFPKDSVALHRERSQKEVPSVVYAEVNKFKPQE